MGVSKRRRGFSWGGLPSPPTGTDDSGEGTRQIVAWSRDPRNGTFAPCFRTTRSRARGSSGTSCVRWRRAPCPTMTCATISKPIRRTRCYLGSVHAGMPDVPHGEGGRSETPRTSPPACRRMSRLWPLFARGCHPWPSTRQDWGCRYVGSAVGNRGRCTRRRAMSHRGTRRRVDRSPATSASCTVESRSTSSAFVASPRRRRWSPRVQRSPC